MPLGAARIALFSRPQVVAQAEVIRAKVGVSAGTTTAITDTESVFGGTAVEPSDGGLKVKNTGDFFNFGTEDFTIEFWLYQLSNTGTSYIHIDARGSNNVPLLFTTGSQKLAFWTNGTNRIEANYTNGVWQHWALSRSGNDFRLFRDGVQQGSTYTASEDFDGAADIITIGDASNGSRVLDGYYDEWRISDTARYTANFTPPTEPFVNDENTLLLLHMDGTPGSQFFEDDNGVRPRESTRAVGSAAISTAQSQFGGSSLELTGNPDIVEIQDKTYFDLQQPQWCVETWFYQETFSSGLSVIIGKRSNNFGWLYYTIGNDLVFNRLGSDNITATGVISQNTWHHTATVRDGNDYYLFLDGQLVAQEFYTDETTVRRANVEIGRDPTDGTRYWDGYIDEVRISDTARYTANFTPSTEPFVNDDNTLLLLHMDGTDGSTDFWDDNGVRSKIGVSAEGNAQISTTESVFGGASAEFDGSGDRLEVAISKNQYITSEEDFTVEGWVYLNSLPSDFFMFAGGENDGYIGITNVNGEYDLTVYVYSENRSQFFVRYDIPATVATNTWYHFAMSKQGDQLYTFWDGASLTISNVGGGAMGSGKGWNELRRIGDYYNLSQGFALDGNIDEFRFSNTARYTANFTPQTEPFQNDDNTLLLLHMDGTDGSQTFVDDNGVPPDWDYGA